MADLKINVRQANADFQAIKNKIIESGVEVADGTRTAEYADKVGEVYEAGKQSMIDESKIIVKTASGIGNLTINDVSELPHDIQCQLDNELFDINKYTILNNGVIGFDISALTIGKDYTFTSKMPLKWFKISTTPDFYNSVAKEDNAFTEFTFTMAKNTNISETATQYLFLGFAIGKAITSTYLLNGYDVSICAVERDIMSRIIEVDGVEYVADVNGLITGIKSTSPIMNFTSSSRMTITYHQSYGVYKQYNEFWDAYQTNTYIYPYHFSSKAWNDNNFYPKRDMIGTSNIYGAFYAIGVTDLVKRLNDCGVKLDTSKATRLGSLFCYAYNITTIPKISAISAPQLASEFLDCLKLKTIECLEVHENLTYGSSVFENCKELENLTIEGVIGQTGFNIRWSTKLSKDSITSIINALSTTATGKTITLSKTAVNNAFTDDKWNSLIATKNNWTIALV